MATKLTIRWDGDTPGLRDHALSIASWNGALSTLLAAVRWSASSIVQNETNNPNYGGRGGRLSNRVAALDLHIVAIRDGCVNIDMVPVFPPSPQQDLFEDELARRALEHVVKCIGDEANSEPRSAPIRKFLRAIPEGVTSQFYRLEVDGEELITREISSTSLPVEPTNLPALRRIDGQIIGVEFEPAQPRVKVRSNGQTIQLSATPSQVEDAIKLRARPVTLMTVSGPAPRIIWLAPAESPPVAPPDEPRATQLIEQWEHTLARLAR